MAHFTADEIRAIADALGDRTNGLTGSEIGHLLDQCKIIDTDPDITKRHRLYNAFVQSQNTRGNRKHILAFIRRAMKPANYVTQRERYEPLRALLNRALAFAGLEVLESGELLEVERASTLSEANRRANELRKDLTSREVHPDVLAFCKPELLNQNYFHAVLEAAKGVAEKIRQRTGLTDDGAPLADRAFGGDQPMLAINSLQTDSDKSEQKGFLNLLKGAFGMFRNTTAHAPKINWAVTKAEAEEVFVLLSLIHRRIDSSKMLPRT